MVRLERLTAAQQETIRRHDEPSLFHLPVRPEKCGLGRETAIDEMRVLGERLAAHLDIDLEPVIAQRVEERLDLLTGPDAP